MVHPVGMDLHSEIQKSETGVKETVYQVAQLRRNWRCSDRPKGTAGYPMRSHQVAPLAPQLEMLSSAPSR